MAENRFRSYKNKDKDLEESRGRRRDTTIELRKNKRVDQLSKRRNLQNIASADTGAGATPLAPVNGDTQQPKQASIAVTQLPEIIAGIKSQDAATVLSATKKCRMLLSKERDPPIQEVIDSGLTPVFVQMLACEDVPDLQFEAAWALTNIASGASDQTMAVVQANAVPWFIRLLSATRADLQEQSVWALGNIAGDSPQLRDYVLSQGVLGPLAQFLQAPGSKVSMLRNGTWTLSNMCRGKSPAPDFDTIKPCIPILAQLLYNQDEEVITDAAWALSYLTDGDNDKIEAVVQSGVVGRLVELLGYNKPAIITPALRAVGNTVTGTDSQTQAVLDAGGLSAFGRLLTSAKETIRKETCWTISNITAGNKQQIQSVCDANLIPMLIQIITSAEFKTRKEATWALSNLTSGGSKAQVQYLVSQAVIKPLSDLLDYQDVKLLNVVLDAITNILRFGEEGGENKFADYFEECGGMEKIEELQSHENEGIYDRALKIIETYFCDEDDGDVDSGATQNGMGSQWNNGPLFNQTEQVPNFCF